MKRALTLVAGGLAVCLAGTALRSGEPAAGPGGAGGEEKPLVSEVVDLRAAAYRGDALKNGIPAYTDRAFPLDKVPAEAAGAIYLRYPNDCKGLRAGGATFTLARPATVYVCADGRAENPPPWLAEGGFKKTELQMIVGAAAEYPLAFYAREFPAGTVQLGPNQGPQGGGGNMYGVAIKEKAAPAEGAAPLVSTVGYARGDEYHGTTFEDKASVYTDRGFALKDVPEKLAGVIYVATPMGLRDSKGAGVGLALSAKAKVFLGLPGGALPDWAEKLGFKKADLEVTVTNLDRAPDFRIPFFVAELGAGRVAFGSNRDEKRADGNMYVIAVQGTAEQNKAGVVSGVPPPTVKKIKPDGPQPLWWDDAPQWTVSIYAGNPSVGPAFQQGPLLETSAPGGYLFAPDGSQLGAAGGAVIVVKDGRQYLFAGVPGVNGHRDGPARGALFSGAIGLAPDGKGGYFVFDKDNLCFRRMFKNDAGEWTVETVAGVPGKQGRQDGPAKEALFRNPWSMAVDSKGRIYTFDDDSLRRIADGKVETLNAKGGSGYKDGPVETARFSISPGAGCCLGEDDVIFLADRWNHCIRKIDLAKNEVTTVCGQRTSSDGWDGPAELCSFGDSPGYVVWDRVRKCLYTNGVDEQRIRRFKDGWMKTVVGGGGALTGPANTIRMNWPGLCGLDPRGDLYIHDSEHPGIIRKATYTGPKVEAK